jgi:hypothetical protein
VAFPEVVAVALLVLVGWVLWLRHASTEGDKGRAHEASGRLAQEQADDMTARLSALENEIAKLKLGRMR